MSTGSPSILPKNNGQGSFIFFPYLIHYKGIGVEIDYYNNPLAYNDLDKFKERVDLLLTIKYTSLLRGTGKPSFKKLLYKEFL